MNNHRLLPVGSSPLELAAADAAADIAAVPVNLDTLWNPQTCPAELLPWLAWALSVDRWDESWPEATKRSVIQSSFFVHQHKGTIGALRRVVEPLGFLIEIKEWWQIGEAPGTFRLVVGVLEKGITEEMYQELERVIDDAKPASRHLSGLAISLISSGPLFVGTGSYDGDSLTIYPYTPKPLASAGNTIRPRPSISLTT